MKEDIHSMIKDLLNYEGPVNEIFMVKQATRAVSNNGSPYLSLTLQDNTGTVEAKRWSIDDDDLRIATAGNLVHVNGRMQVYRGHPQRKITELEGVREGDADLAKFVPAAPTPLEERKAELNQDIARIKDKELHDLVLAVLKDRLEDYLSYPAAVTVHHAYLHGLLYHSLSICRNAIAVQKNYPWLSLDYLIAGSLLHDIGKTKELSGSMAANYTTEGNLIGHIALGARIVYSTGEKLGINKEKLDVLTHRILSHHGELEFGSPKVPRTAEAYVLHSLDDLDAKRECLKMAYEGTKEGAFTGKIIWMNNTAFYKPKKEEDK